MSFSSVNVVLPSTIRSGTSPLFTQVSTFSAHRTWGKYPKSHRSLMLFTSFFLIFPGFSISFNQLCAFVFLSVFLVCEPPRLVQNDVASFGSGGTASLLSPCKLLKNSDLPKTAGSHSDLLCSCITWVMQF